MPTGSKASIMLRVLEGEGMYWMYTGVYMATTPSGSRILSCMALNIVANSRFPPALSPTTAIFLALVPKYQQSGVIIYEPWWRYTCDIAMYMAHRGTYGI